MPASATTTHHPDGRSKPRPGIEEQRRAIIETATRLFAEQNARSVSIQDLCRAAGISRPTFYRAFEDKDALLAYVYDLAIDRYVDQLFLDDLPAPTTDFRAWLTAAVDEMVDGVCATPDLARFALVEYGDPTSPAREHVNSRFRRAARRVQRAMRQAGRDAPSELYLMSVMAAIQWTLYETLLAGPTVARRDAAKASIVQLARTAFGGSGR